ncbi:MAG: peptidase C14 [Catenulispora sp.]|nr:peptidase C14 [Catenulispora sp.]
MHDGCLDFRKFGVFDAKTPADAALDAMVNDPAVSRIEAHTDLNFVKRHKFRRSDLVLDFGGHLMRTDGIEKAGQDDPFAAVLFFQGELTKTVVTAKQSRPVADLSDVFEVPDSKAFAVGQWWTAEVDPLSGRWERELQKLVEVTQLVDGTHIRVNYKNGWELKAGRTVTWTLVKPVERVHVRNLRFAGVAGGDQYTGSHPLAYEYAIHCDVDGVHAAGTFWPVVMRRWCTHYRTERCTLRNPASVTWGGAGYLTQQIYCLYGHVADCHTANARHLNDFTASAYCYVDNCHGDGDDQGPFVTHGQYEHDLTYTGNSGLMTFANSGAAWGSAAKRITVRKHVCSWFVARVKVTDLTLEDLQVIGKPSLQGSGMIWVNADGIQMRGCQASDTLIVSQASKLSNRPNLIDGCAFTVPAKGELVQANVTAPLHVTRSTFNGLNGNAFNGADLRMSGCSLNGAEGAAPLSLAGSVTLSGCTVSGVGLAVQGKADQQVRLDGGTVLSDSGLSRADATGLVSWQLYGTRTRNSAIRLDAGRNRWSATGCEFTGGSLSIKAFEVVRHTGNLEEGVSRELPPDGAKVLTSGNLVV